MMTNNNTNYIIIIKFSTIKTLKGSLDAHFPQVDLIL